MEFITLTLGFQIRMLFVNLRCRETFKLAKANFLQSIIGGVIGPVATPFHHASSSIGLAGPRTLGPCQKNGKSNDGKWSFRARPLRRCLGHVPLSLSGISFVALKAAKHAFQSVWTMADKINRVFLCLNYFLSKHEYRWASTASCNDVGIRNPHGDLAGKPKS